MFNHIIKLLAYELVVLFRITSTSQCRMHASQCRICYSYVPPENTVGVIGLI